MGGMLLLLALAGPAAAATSVTRVELRDRQGRSTTDLMPRDTFFVEARVKSTTGFRDVKQVDAGLPAAPRAVDAGIPDRRGQAVHEAVDGLPLATRLLDHLLRDV